MAKVTIDGVEYDTDTMSPRRPTPLMS